MLQSSFALLLKTQLGRQTKPAQHAAAQNSTLTQQWQSSLSAAGLS